MTEWPLVIFTVALQASCGLALSATLFDRASGNSQDAAMRRLGLAAFPLIALGLVASLVHLGRPFSALRSLSNLGSSRLSLEILLSLLFAAAAFVYGLRWWRGITPKRFWFGAVTSLIGLAAVGSSFVIYMIPTQPAWNAGWLPISFVGTVLLFAGIVPVSLLEISHTRLFKAYLMLGLAGGSAHLVSTVWMLATLSQSTLDVVAAARFQGALHLLTSDSAFSLGLYIFLAVVLPVALVLWLWPGKHDSGGTAAAKPEKLSLKTIVLLAIVAGVIIGRTLMYAIVTSIPPF